MCVCVWREGRAETTGGDRFFFLPCVAKKLTRPPFVGLPSFLSGYARVLCAAYAFSVALTNPVQCIVFYFVG